MRPGKWFFILALATATECSAVTIMKNVGHGDCYIVVSDGRTVVVDLGPAGTAEGLVALLRTGQFHFDRIVVTHVHADHVGGLITAAQYASLQGNALTTDRLVSNHGTHDLNVIMREPQLRHLLASMRETPVVGLTDPALRELAFSDENIAVEAFALDEPRASRPENPSSLVVKVTEIRDGKRRAVLFLGDIEKSQQDRLFADPRAKDIFRDVGAITLPHHGRAATLHRRFLDRVRKFAGPDVVLLHSDRDPLDPSIAKKAAKQRLRVESTASHGSDVAVNLFGSEKIHHVVDGSTRTLTQIVREGGSMQLAGDLELDEVVNAVAKFTDRPRDEALAAGTTISWPTDAWIRTTVNAQRAAETDRLLGELALRRGTQFDELRQTIAARPSISDVQQQKLRVATEVETNRREQEYRDETERLITQLRSKRKADSQAAVSRLPERVAIADPDQVNRIQHGTADAARRFRLDPKTLADLHGAVNKRVAEMNAARAERLIVDLRSSSADTRDAAAKALSQMGSILDERQIDRIIEVMRSEGDYVEADSWRGPHCTHYERRAPKYYAGRALEGIASARISESVRREARLAQTQGSVHQRIDDPGWI